MANELDRLRAPEPAPLATPRDERGRIAAAVIVVLVAGAIAIVARGATPSPVAHAHHALPVTAQTSVGTSSALPPAESVDVPARGIVVDDAQGVTLYSDSEIVYLDGVHMSNIDSVHAALKDRYGRRLVLRGGRQTFGAQALPKPRNGQYTLLAPDGRWTLAQDGSTAYLSNAANGQRTPIGPTAIGLGWTKKNLAVIYLPVGSGSRGPGVYLMRPPGVFVDELLLLTRFLHAASWGLAP